MYQVFETIRQVFEQAKWLQWEAPSETLSRRCHRGIDAQLHFDESVGDSTIQHRSRIRSLGICGLQARKSFSENWATIASLIETCKLNAVDPFGYLTATLNAIVNGHKQSRIEDLLPWNYPVR